MKINGVKVNINWETWWSAVKDWANRYGANPNLLYAAAMAEDRGLSSEEVQGMMAVKHSINLIDNHRNLLTEQMKPENAKTIKMGTRLAPIDGVQEIFLGNASDLNLKNKSGEK